MEFQGYIYHQRSPFYVTLMLPIVSIKNGIELLRKFLQKLIWAELIHKPPTPSLNQELLTIIVFLIFCLVCIASHRYSHFYGLIVGLSAACWYLDLTLSKRDYGHKLNTNLHITKDEYCYYHLQNNHTHKFHRSQLAAIGVQQPQIFSHAFGAPIARPWQISLVLENGETLIVDEIHKTVPALTKSQALATSFQVPVTFAATPNLELDTDAIKISKQPHQWHIFSQWTSKSSKLFFAKVSNDSGFLLFAIVLTEFMARFGGLLDQTLGYYQQTGGIYLNIGYLWTGYKINWLELTTAAIAIAMMIWRGIQISQVKHIYLDATQITYAINRKPIARLNCIQLKYLTLIDYPETMLLIFDGQAAIEIKDLLQPQDFQALFMAITAGMQELCPN